MAREEREEAIEQLEIAKGLIEQNGEDYLDERDIPLLNSAIEALQQQEEYVTKMDEVRRAYDNISKAQPCEDYVSRQAIEEIIEIMTDINGNSIYAARMSDIRALPSETLIDKRNSEPCDEQSVYMRAYREGYDKGYSDGDFFARHADETREPCEGAVNREAVKSALCKLCGDKNKNRCSFVNGDCDILKVIKALPPVTSRSKMGHWITLKDEYGDVVEAVCSCCDKNGNHKWSLCPYCGAIMVEQQESEDKK